MTNKGDVAGDDSVLLFATDVVRMVTPRYKLLKGFDKIRLEPGLAKKVNPSDEGWSWRGGGGGGKG